MPGKVHTHYDNLKVARTAPPEVIRAAYRALSQRFHPDRNPGNLEATRIMQVVNAAYEVLSDPRKRAEHDRWIAEQEAQATSKGSAAFTPPPRPARPSEPDAANVHAEHPDPPPVWEKARMDEDMRVKVNRATNQVILGVWAGLLLMLVAVYFWEDMKRSEREERAARAQASAPKSPAAPKVSADQFLDAPAPASKLIEAARYRTPVNRLSADEYLDQPPTGSPKPNQAASLPRQTGYVAGKPVLNQSGRSTLTVDNSRNGTAVHVKLFSIAQGKPVREFVISERSQFTLENLTAGRYDLRFRDLVTNSLSRMDEFSIDEYEDSEGVRFTNASVTIYTVSHGNMRTHKLSESDF